jgi:hypothetical protein
MEEENKRWCKKYRRT